MKKYIPAIIAVIVLLLLVLRSLAGVDKKTYEVYEENGQWYIKADVGVPWEVTEHQPGYLPMYSLMDLNAVASPILTFSSVAEFRNEVSNQGLTVRQLQWLQYFSGSRSDPIPICDLDNLYEPVAPKAVADPEIIFYGENYTYPFTFNGRGYSGCFHILYDLEEYQSRFSEYYGLQSGKAPEIIVDETATGKTAWDILKETDTINQDTTELRFTLHADTGDVWYVYDPYVPGLRSNKRTVHMFCQRENVGFWVEVKYTASGVRVDFLADFGVKPVE